MATDVTLYLLTVIDALKVIQCIALVLFFSEIYTGILHLFKKRK